MTVVLVYHVLFRFIHISSAIALLGGMVYARQVFVPTLNLLPEDVRLEAAGRAQKRYRTTLFTLLVLIVGSGFYNLLGGPKHTYAYEIWFGIKMLLVAHIFSAAILWVTSPYGDVKVGSRSKHRLVSAAISGLIVGLISAYLRSLTQQGL
ncbi:MAG: hypothetical protein ACR2IV_09380 [Bryobacteraceae bacterium]